MKTVTYDDTQWKLVPIEPTEEMHRAGRTAMTGRDIPTNGYEGAAYDAMLAAAPTPPAVEQPDSVMERVLSDAVTHGVGMVRIDPSELYQPTAQDREDAERWRFFMQLLDDMGDDDDSQAPGFPHRLHEAFQEGSKATIAALDAARAAKRE